MDKIKHIAQGPWWAISCSLRASKYGDDITEIKFQHADDAKMAYTYIDEQNNNSRYWNEVIELCNNNYRVKVGDLIYKTEKGKIKLHSRSRLPLVDADTKVCILDYEKDPELQAQADYRQALFHKKIQDLDSIFSKDIKGKYIIDHVVNDPALKINSHDDINDIQAKLKLNGLIKFADMLNRGIVK